MDVERIEKLVIGIMELQRNHFLTGPHSRSCVYEVLNALAVCTANVIKGTGDPEALEWFSQALNTNLIAKKDLGQDLDRTDVAADDGPGK